MDKIKQLFQTKNSRRGSYSIAVTAVVIGIVILFNLLVAQLPQKIRQIDISDTNIYEISSTSQKLLKNLDKDVSLYVIAEKGNTDDRIRTFITKYASLSSRLRVEWIDPVLHPSALTKYDTEKNSIVVSCKATDRQTSISFDDILVTESSYYNTSSSATKFDGDGQHRPEYIEAMRQKMEEGYDIVIGSRFVTEKKGWSARMIGSRVIGSAIRLTTGTRVTDPTSGMRMFNRKMIEEFALNLNYGPEPDTVSFLIKQGARVAELQVTIDERTEGESYLKPLTAVHYMARMLISILMIQNFRKR